MTTRAPAVLISIFHFIILSYLICISRRVGGQACVSHLKIDLQRRGRQWVFNRHRIRDSLALWFLIILEVKRLFNTECVNLSIKCRWQMTDYEDADPPDMWPWLDIHTEASCSPMGSWVVLLPLLVDILLVNQHSYHQHKHLDQNMDTFCVQRNILFVRKPICYYLPCTHCTSHSPLPFLALS